MDLQNYFEIIYKRKMLILLSIAICIFISFIFSYILMQPRFRATARIIVNSESTSKTEPITLDQKNLNLMVMNEKLAKHAMKILGIKNISNSSANNILERVSVNMDNLGVIRISYRGENPKKCADIANAFAGAFVEMIIRSNEDVKRDVAEVKNQKDSIRQLRTEIAGQLKSERPNNHAYKRLILEKKLVDELDMMVDKHYSSVLKTSAQRIARITEKAKEPAFPYYPNRKKNIATGLLIGVMLGVYAAFLLEAKKNTSEKAKTNLSRNYR